MSLIFYCLIIFVLLLLSAIFSSSETAIIASSKATLNQLSKKGDERASIIVRLRLNMGRLISAIMIGNTVINTVASTIATSLFIDLFGTAGVAYASFVMSLLIVLYGEVLPKIYAIQHPEALARRVAYGLNIMMNFLSPLTRTIEFIARSSLRLFGVKLKVASGVTTTEELRSLIEMHIGPGEDTAHERAMLRSVLDLGVVEVGEIMTHRKNVKMIDIDQDIDKIIEVLLESPYTRVPLWQGDPDNIIGILHAKALFRAIKEAVDGDASKINLKQIANVPWFIPDTTALLDQLHAFRQRREHFALVVDEYGSFMGVVTLEDILEEIVGEIVDEHDIEIPGVRVAQDKSILVMGTVTIRDLNRQFEWSLPDGEASTIAGLVLHETRQIPNVGQKFSIHGFNFEILRRQRNQITFLRIVPPLEEQELAEGLGE
jgi:Mg2+/Co2+ transporter CorB